MEKMETQSCLTCAGPLRPGNIKYKQYRCISCQQRSRIAFLLSETTITATFSLLWTQVLFKRLGAFLGEHGVSLDVQARLLSKAAQILQAAERTFDRREEMSEVWLEEMIEKAGRHFAFSFFRTFLIEEHLLSPTSQDEKLLRVCKTRIEQVPQGYRRLIEVIFQERMSLRERQVKNQAKKPLSMQTLASDLDLLIRLVRWLIANFPELPGWEMVQEEQLNLFLLTLPPVSRELVRKKLYQYFRVGRKRRVITHIPVVNLPSRRLAPTVEPLKVEEQKAVARQIQRSRLTHPEEALLSALCFYHGLSSSQLRQIKLHAIDLEKKAIFLENRPPVYLLEEDLLLLEQYLLKRQTLPYAKSRSYLFANHQKKLTDEPVTTKYIQRKVRALTGLTPQRLWISCYAALAAQYGPQYLVAALGLSLSHTARYGKLQEFLLEEEVKQQREAFLELSHQLEQGKKPRSPRPRGGS